MKKQNADHYIFEVTFDNFPSSLEDAEFWNELGKDALKEGDFEILAENFKKFEPQGMSGFWLLSESHLSFHTWPEEKIVFIDLFSCGDNQQAERTYRYLEKQLIKLGGKIENLKILTRGFAYQKNIGE